MDAESDYPRVMVGRTTITLPGDLEAAVRAYQRDMYPAATTLSAVVEAALREFLSQRGYVESGRRLRLTPAARGSGLSDVSANHDRYLE